MSFFQELPGIQSRMEKESQGSIPTPLVSLPTPGKATVQVVILADPDGQEICFVGSEAFDELSRKVRGKICIQFFTKKFFTKKSY
jgi:hypothetical protein